MKKETARWAALLEKFKTDGANVTVISVGFMPIRGIIYEVHLDYIEVKTTAFNPDGTPQRGSLLYIPFVAVVGIEISQDLTVIGEKENDRIENSASFTPGRRCADSDAAKLDQPD